MKPWNITWSQKPSQQNSFSEVIVESFHKDNDRNHPRESERKTFNQLVAFLGTWNLLTIKISTFWVKFSSISWTPVTKGIPSLCIAFFGSLNQQTIKILTLWMKISSLLSYIEPWVKSYSINHTLSRTTIHNQNTYTKTIYLKSQTNPGLCITFFSTINNLKKKKTSKNPNFMNNFSSIFFYVKTEVRS